MSVSRPSVWPCRKLEDELGVVLFERHTAEVGVTPAGEKVVEQALCVLEEVEVIRQIAEHGKNSWSGHCGWAYSYRGALPVPRSDTQSA